MSQDAHTAIQSSLAYDTRPSWDEIWMSIAKTISGRSIDPKHKVCAIIVPEDNTGILAIGYNGNYRGGPHERDSNEVGQSGLIHAEVNALIKCDYNYPKLNIMYTTLSPCRACSKLIINASIHTVVYDELYEADHSGLRLMEESGIHVYSMKDLLRAMRP